MPHRPGVDRRQAAFSLVEIMVVIVIIGLLASVVTLNVRGYLNKAKANTARQEIATVVQALETFYATYGRYPTNEEGIEVLTKPGEKLPEQLLKSVPVDPWGHPYQYNCPGRTGPFEVICYGSDGREGGTGIDTDISSDKLKE
ncbi:MAG: type II secretion system major pseudopilin GspG [Phycisphaerae bacterium]|jgi:general secretion pathway protein G